MYVQYSTVQTHCQNPLDVTPASHSLHVISKPGLDWLLRFQDLFPLHHI